MLLFLEQIASRVETCFGQKWCPSPPCTLGVYLVYFPCSLGLLQLSLLNACLCSNWNTFNWLSLKSLLTNSSNGRKLLPFFSIGNVLWWSCFRMGDSDLGGSDVEILKRILTTALGNGTTNALVIVPSAKFILFGCVKHVTSKGICACACSFT